MTESAEHSFYGSQQGVLAEQATGLATSACFRDTIETCANAMTGKDADTAADAYLAYF